ncbi:MAG: Asp-tRNA(Asn)/Glu-tRNA(Gln) amidotransferase subunit GatC [Bdellovibrionales bacterium]
MISEAEVQRVAHLARITLTEAEAKELAAQLSSVLHNFEQIKSVPTEGVEPLVTATDMVAVWREDKVENWANTEAALANAPETMGNLFRVPPVVG